MLVFISHSSKDILFIQPFKDIILKEALGLRDENIICTSFESTGVEPGENIPKYIMDNIDSANVFLSMVSPNYKRSEVCLNEVGAAWALGKCLIQVVLPGEGEDYKNLGWLINLDKATRINNGDMLDSLAEKICKELGMSMPTPKHWNPSRERFLHVIAGAAEIVQKESQPCGLYFENQSQEMLIRPKYRVIRYCSPYPFKDNGSQYSTPLSKFGFDGTAFNTLAASYKSNPVIQAANPVTRETYCQICLLKLWFYNLGDSLEDIEVRINAPEGVEFREKNYKNVGLSSSLLMPHSESFSVDQNSYWCRIGDINAETNRAMPLFYIEITSICGKFDDIENIKHLYPSQVHLPYVISTKHKKYKGILDVVIEPEFIEEIFESERLAGKNIISPVIERT